MPAPLRMTVVLEQLLAPVPGGTGRYARELSAALADHAEVEVGSVVARHADVAAARVRGVDGPARLAVPPRVLSRLWERGLGPGVGPADVVLAPTLLAPPRRAAPLVVVIHDAVPWTHPETLTARGVRFHRRAAARVADTADLVLTPSQATADALRAAGVRPRRVVVVGAGVSALFSTPTACSPGRSDQPRADPGHWLVVGTLEPRKGLDVAVQALAECWRAGVRLPLLVVGPAGWGDPHLHRLPAGLPEHAVQLLGRRPDAEMVALLRGATALLAPSRAEGFGLPVAEAMAAGTPVVISDDPALVELAGPAVPTAPRGDAAALAERMQQVAHDAGLRERLARQGRLRAADLTWDRVADRLLAAVRPLVGDQPDRG